MMTSAANERNLPATFSAQPGLCRLVASDGNNLKSIQQIYGPALENRRVLICRVESHHRVLLPLSI